MTTPIENTDTFQRIAPQEIAVSRIDPSPLNRHCDDADADIAELAQTIKENGLLYPISARYRDGGRYEIICGERRWRAFRLLERETIPCIVKDLDDSQAQIERIVENFQRRDPSFMEQGEAVAALMELTDRDVTEVANRLGQSVSWVRRRAKLPNLIPAWREELTKDNTPYFAIRDSVNKLEEIAVLPAATQQTILTTGVLRYVKTTREMRNAIAKHFMDLDAKPWARAWEKKAFSGSGKKRCDACMRRSDRENALFADPNNANAEKKMCLDPQCWKNKCLSWCQSLLSENPDMVPIRHGYSYGGDDLTEFFGVKPVSYYDWHKREDTEAREGYVAAVGVFVDGPNIGTTQSIWLEVPDESDDGAGDDTDAIDIHHRRDVNTARHREREALTELIAADIAEYLADIDSHATIPIAQLDQNKTRACFWFGVDSAGGNDESSRIDDPAWNPLAYAWEAIVESLAGFVATVAAEDMAQLYSGDRDSITDGANSAALVAMFEIPLDVIATRANDALHQATREEQDADADNQNNTDDATVEDTIEPIAPIVAIDVGALTDPDSAIFLENAPYLHLLVNAQ